MRRKFFRVIATPFRKTAHTFPGAAPRFRTIAEIGLFIVVVVACTVNLHEERADRTAALASSSHSDGLKGDALKVALLRCQSLGKAALDDPACTSAWAENRRRFFAPEPKADADHRAPDQPQVRRFPL